MNFFFFFFLNLKRNLFRFMHQNNPSLIHLENKEKNENFNTEEAIWKIMKIICDKMCIIQKQEKEEEGRFFSFLLLLFKREEH